MAGRGGMGMHPGSMMQPQIVLLREGTDTSQGKAQLISNINACQAVVDVVRTTLGPRGMDKLIHDDKGQVTISNDGATLMKLLQIVHPAAHTLVQISMSQDAEVGDGTTSVVLLAGEFLRECKPYIEEGVHPQSIVKAFRTACNIALKQLDAIAVKLDELTGEKRREMLEKAAATSLSSKLVASHKEFFAKMVRDRGDPPTPARPAPLPPLPPALPAHLSHTPRLLVLSQVTDAILSLHDSVGTEMIGMKKVQGGALGDSLLVEGVAFKKTFSCAPPPPRPPPSPPIPLPRAPQPLPHPLPSTPITRYAGFEQMTKSFDNPKIVLLNIELELKAERDNAELRVSNIAEYQQVVDAEWEIIYEKLAKIVASGANIVLSRLAIGDLATQVPPRRRPAALPAAAPPPAAPPS